MELAGALVITALTAAGAGGPSSPADPSSPEGDEAQHAQARVLIDAGTRAYAAKDYGAALDAFRRAYAVIPDHRIQFNIGRAALETGDVAIAANAFQGFLKGTIAAPAFTDQRSFAQQTLDSLKVRVAVVHVEVTPANATVSIDGEVVGVAQELTASGGDVAAGELFVLPGTHHVDAHAADLGPISQTFTVRRAERREVVLRLGLEPSRSVASADEVTQPSHASAPTAATPGTTPTVETAAEPSDHHTGGWIVVGIGAASAVASGVLYGLAVSQHNQAITNIQRGKSPTGAEKTGSAEQSASAATLVAGMVGIGGGLALVFTTQF